MKICEEHSIEEHWKTQQRAAAWLLARQEGMGFGL